MQATFIRHVAAEPAGAAGDQARCLTDSGVQQVRTSVEALRRLGVKLEMILSGPLVRAVQTAGLLAQANEGADVEQTALLSPPADAEALRSRLAKVLADKPQTVGIVGHSPSLDDCIGTLLPWPGGPCPVSVPKTGWQRGTACRSIPGFNCQANRIIR